MRRVCVFTGSRADYGPMLPVIRKLHDDPDVDLRMLVTGGHLAAAQGMTSRQVETDGFRVDEKVEMVLASDTPTGVAKSLGLGVIGYADALDRISPEILVLLGDRYEALAIAIAASLRLLPIAHIGGGELTTGSTDDPVRHAISKLSHLHFTTTQEFRQRVIQLGEPPERVHHTGAPGLDTIRTMELLGRPELSKLLRIPLAKDTILVTYHPATADAAGSLAGAIALLKALDRFADSTIVFTGTNVDQGGSTISNLIHEYVSRHSTRAITMPSLGQSTYLSLVKHAAVVVGNSSSGIAEAPALHTPSVNIGSRQNGRPKAGSVIDCGNDPSEIEQSIRQALTPRHREITDSVNSPYGDGKAADRIVKIIKSADLGDLARKQFYDIP